MGRALWGGAGIYCCNVGLLNGLPLLEERFSTLVISYQQVLWNKKGLVGPTPFTLNVRFYAESAATAASSLSKCSN